MMSPCYILMITVLVLILLIHHFYVRCSLLGLQIKMSCVEGHSLRGKEGGLSLNPNQIRKSHVPSSSSFAFSPH